MSARLNSFVVAPGPASVPTSAAMALRALRVSLCVVSLIAVLRSLCHLGVHQPTTSQSQGAGLVRGLLEVVGMGRRGNCFGFIDVLGFLCHTRDDLYRGGRIACPRLKSEPFCWHLEA